MPAQFPYPGVPWSQGEMRKNGYRPDFEEEFAQVAPAQSEMTTEQKAFEAQRPGMGEEASGKAQATPTDEQMMDAISKAPLGKLLGWFKNMNPDSISQMVGELTKQQTKKTVAEAQ